MFWLLQRTGDDRPDFRWVCENMERTRLLDMGDRFLLRLGFNRGLNFHSFAAGCEFLSHNVWM